MISLCLLLTFLTLGQAQQNADMCIKTANPLGSCTCDQQLFINEDCTTGFLCRDDVNQENPANDGCMIQCNEGWKLVADPRNGGHWYCTNISQPICPGKFNTGSVGVRRVREVNPVLSELVVHRAGYIRQDSDILPDRSRTVTYQILIF